jgi:glycosyltransferase involved in cell wall biosynthesis
MPNLGDVKSAALVALHFAPVHASHMIAQSKILASLGYSVTFLLDPRYNGFADFCSLGRVVWKKEVGNWLETVPPSIVLIANAAVGNMAFALKSRRRGARVFYLFHEPISLIDHRREGWKDLAKLAIAQITSIVTVSLSDQVLVPSRFALGSYWQHFGVFNRNARVMELLFDDEVEDEVVKRSLDSRANFSFLGYASDAHDFPAYIAFVKWAHSRDALLRFAVATRSDISELIDKDCELRALERQGVIRIQHGRVLSQAEMLDWYLKSYCVWNAYRYCTQSGVLPRAFMCGTPVLGVDRGSLADYVLPGQTGEIVSDGRDFPGILDALRKIRTSLPTYIEQCRKAFFESFHWQAGCPRLREIVNAGMPRYTTGILNTQSDRT